MELTTWNVSTEKNEEEKLENKTLGTERCANVDTLFINKNYYCYYYH